MWRQKYLLVACAKFVLHSNLRVQRSWDSCGSRHWDRGPPGRALAKGTAHMCPGTTRPIPLIQGIRCMVPMSSIRINHDHINYHSDFVLLSRIITITIMILTYWIVDHGPITRDNDQ